MNDDPRLFMVQDPRTADDVLGGMVGIDNANLRTITTEADRPLVNDLKLGELTYGLDRLNRRYCIVRVV